MEPVVAGGYMLYKYGFSLLLAELMIGTRTYDKGRISKTGCFSLLLAELMIGTINK